MIQLTNEQAEQLHTNLSRMVADLEEIVHSDEDITFLNIGGKAGLALQKAYDAQTFILNLLIKAEKTKSSPPLDMSPEEKEAFHTLRNFNRSHHS